MAGFTFAAPGGSSGHGSGHAGGHGAFGFVSNLVHDIGDAAKGTPEGLVQLAEHPIRTTENMGKATWQTWSPLFHGHVGQFGHQFYAHPLAPMLDIATVFTGGASLAAKIGVKAGEAGLISEDSALAKLGNMPQKITLHPPRNEAGKVLGKSYDKYLPKNPIYNKGYRSAMSFADKHPAIPNWFGSAKTYERLQHADWANAGLALRAQYSAAMKAGEVLTKAGKTEFGPLEQQLHMAAYKDLWHNSPEVPVSEIMSKYGGKMPPGFAPIKPGMSFDKPVYGSASTNVAQFGGRIKQLGDKMIVRPGKWQEGVYKNAATGEDVVRLAHRQEAAANFLDGAKSASFLTKLYKYPTAVWKYSLIGLSPRTVVDNSIGNWTMYALRQGGEHGLKGFVDAVRYTRGEGKALKMVKETGKLPEDGHFLNTYFKGELGNTFGSAVLGEDGTGSALSKAYQKSMYPLVHKFADRPVRAAAISGFLRGDSAVKGLMRAGHSFEDAAHTALAANPELRTRAVLHARTVAGNYTSLSAKEQAMRDFVPFYLWDKHIVMHASNMLRDRPGVVAVGSSLGQQGANASRNSLGNVPEFMLGSIKLPFQHFMGGGGNRTALLDTTGLNPYSTVPDLVSTAQALIPGHGEDKPADAVLGQTNPFLQAVIQQTMGTQASGAPVQTHGGILPSMAVDVANSIPEVSILRTILGAGKKDTTKSGKPTLYKSDLASLLTTRAGFPVKLADLVHAAQLQQQIENNNKKPKKGHGFSYAP